MNKSDWLTVDILKKLVSYNPYTGIFTDKRTGKVLNVAPSTKTMYIRREDGKNYQLSPGRCAWMLMRNEFPPELVMTKVSMDYRWKNLKLRGGFHQFKDSGEVPIEYVMVDEALVLSLEDRVALLEEKVRELTAIVAKRIS